MHEAPSITEAVNYRPEEALLVRCARVARDSANELRIEELLHRVIDWEYLLETASEHRMLPLLYWHLEAVSSEAVPGEIMDWLASRFQMNKMRTLLLAGELLQLCEMFRRRGISVIPYKGPTLAASVYGDLGLRKTGDLDMLVRRRDVPEAREMLLSRGYKLMPWKTDIQLTPEQDVAFLRFEREYAFQHYDSGIGVELQWEFIPRHFSFSLDLESVQDRLKVVTLGGGLVPALSPEDTLLVLCVHGSKHFFERLQWICDVAETVRACNELDWGLLMERATVLGSKRMVLLGLHLARDLLEADIPEDVSRLIGMDPGVDRLAEDVYEQLFQRHEKLRGFLEGSVFRSFHYRMYEKRRDRVRYALRAAVEPNETDWMNVSLPVWLFPLYYALRPLRLIGKYGRRLSRRHQ